MSDYNNFIKDFPSRCEKLRNRIEKENKFDDLTVTGLLMVASSAVNIPYDRLRPVSGDMMPHPSGDSEKYSEAARQFKQLLVSNFVGSCLCPDDKVRGWKLAKPKDIQGDPDGWETVFKEISKEKKVSSLLKIIRNALAHGNIYTKGSIIDQILFISIETKKDICDKCGSTKYRAIDYYNCLSVTPDAFERFLKGWFQFINKFQIPPIIFNDFEDENKYAATG